MGVADAPPRMLLPSGKAVEEHSDDSFHTLKYLEDPSDASKLGDLHELIRPHLDGFNALFDCNVLELAVKNLEARVLYDKSGNCLKFWLEDVKLSNPMLSEKERHSFNRFIYPAECRERGISYSGVLSCNILVQVNEEPMVTLPKTLGNVPVMVKSVKCNLYNAGPTKLIRHHEDAEELGGYFIGN